MFSIMCFRLKITSKPQPSQGGIMTMIDTSSKGVMDNVNVEQQKNAQLIKGMQGMAKTEKAEADPKKSPSVDTVKISERARQASANRQMAAGPRRAKESSGGRARIATVCRGSGHPAEDPAGSSGARSKDTRFFRAGRCPGCCRKRRKRVTASGKASGNGGAPGSPNQRIRAR